MSASGRLSPQWSSEHWRTLWWDATFEGSRWIRWVEGLRARWQAVLHVLQGPRPTRAGTQARQQELSAPPWQGRRPGLFLVLPALPFKGGDAAGALLFARDAGHALRGGGSRQRAHAPRHRRAVGHVPCNGQLAVQRHGLPSLSR